jgi:hypothetical protein
MNEQLQPVVPISPTCDRSSSRSPVALSASSSTFFAQRVVDGQVLGKRERLAGWHESQETAGCNPKRLAQHQLDRVEQFVSCRRLDDQPDAPAAWLGLFAAAIGGQEQDRMNL